MRFQHERDLQRTGDGLPFNSVRRSLRSAFLNCVQPVHGTAVYPKPDARLFPFIDWRVLEGSAPFFRDIIPPHTAARRLVGNWQYSRFQDQCLRKTITFFREKGVRVILYQLPVHPDVAEQLRSNPKYAEGYAKFLEVRGHAWRSSARPHSTRGYSGLRRARSGHARSHPLQRGWREYLFAVVGLAAAHHAGGRHGHPAEVIVRCAPVWMMPLNYSMESVSPTSQLRPASRWFGRGAWVTLAVFSVEVDLEDADDRRVVLLVERADGHDARVVDEDVERPEARARPRRGRPVKPRRSVTSSGRPTRRPPSSSAAAAADGGVHVADRRRGSPRATSAAASALPMPRPPPVTTATLPWSERGCLAMKRGASW